MSRFLYIDSKGKEIPIPSVDALALRIELGAVKEDTQFYDSASDRWAPAGEHEVFRSLQREAEDKSAGFVAPPPPPLPPPPVVPRAPAPEPPPPPPPAPLETPAAPAGHDVFGGMDLGLTLDATAMDASVENAAAERAAAEPFTVEKAPAPAARKDEGFEFQGFGGGLADDDEDDDEEDEEERPARAASAPDGGGLAIEGVLAASYDLSGPGHGGVSAEKIETDAPLSEQSGPPNPWARLETVDENDEAVAAAEAEHRAAMPAPREARRGGGDAAGGGDRPPRARPAPAAAPEKSGMPMALVAGIVLVVLGGGFFGWRALRGGGEPAAVEEVDPTVTIPDLPPSLEPRMREVAQLALEDWVVAVRDSLPAQRGVPAEPDAAWLGSQYMADASQFSAVAQYWAALDAYVTSTLDGEQRIYEQLLDARLVDSLGAPDPDAAALKARAAAGFEAGRPDRRVVYGQLRSVIEAATGLHEFLVENQDRIEYQPGPERDPVLEAVPDSPELGDEMWSRVDGITAALDGLGAMDKVTTQRLIGVAADRFREIGIR